jgi:hypothetical protein
MLRHIATISACYGGHFESKMTTKIQKSSDLGEIWYFSRHDSQKLGSNYFLLCSHTILHSYHISMIKQLEGDSLQVHKGTM